MSGEKSDRIDALVAEICAGISHAEQQTDRAQREAVQQEDDLLARLAEANAAVCAPLALRFPARLLRRLMAPLFDRQERQMMAQIQVLNKLIRVLDGRDSSWSSGPVLERHHRRVDLLEQLAKRLEACEQQGHATEEDDA